MPLIYHINSVSSEFTNGVLGANGILLGFWTVIIGISKKDNPQLWKNKGQIMIGLFVSLFILMFSVFSMYLNALEIIQPLGVLTASVLGFYFTVIFLGITLYYGVFRETKK